MCCKSVANFLLPSGKVWPELVFMEEMQPKSSSTEVKTRSSNSSMHENIGTGVQKNGNRCSGQMSQNLKYFCVAVQRYNE